jgi:hypothetical protein
VVVVVVLVARGGGDEPAPDAAAAPAATATPCREAKRPYGSAPGGFAYERAGAATREKTVNALGLDPKGVDMRVARRTGIALGSLVGVPSQDPGAYVEQVVGRAQRAAPRWSPATASRSSRSPPAQTSRSAPADAARC